MSNVYDNIEKIINGIASSKAMDEDYFSYKHNKKAKELVFDDFILTLVYRFHWRHRKLLSLTKNECQEITDLIHIDTRKYRHLKSAIDFPNKGHTMNEREEVKKTIEFQMIEDIVNKYNKMVWQA